MIRLLTLKVHLIGVLFFLFPSMPVQADIDLGEAVSFYVILASPEGYDGQRIRIKARIFAVAQSDSRLSDDLTFLFPTSESLEFFNLHEALVAKPVGPMITDEGFFEHLREWNGEMVEIIGSFENKSQPSGAVGMFHVETYRKAEKIEAFHD